MLRFYAAGDVERALPWPALVDALARAFAQGAEVPLRHVHRLDGDDTLLLMPAWRNAAADGGEGALGVKLVTVMPGNAARGVSTVAALYVLIDRSSGEPSAVIDGEALTLRRTAAASALAARFLARADAATLLVVGTGKLAPYLARAHCALRSSLRRVRVWGRTAARADAMAGALRAELAGIDVDVAPDLERAVRDADVISCATTATAPIVRGAWIAPGTHLDLVGGFTRAMREADDDAVARARLFVDTYVGALAEAGDLVDPIERGVVARDRVEAELAQLVRGERAGRLRADEVTLFKSVGTALEDLAAAQLVAGGSVG